MSNHTQSTNRENHPIGNSQCLSQKPPLGTRETTPTVIKIQIERACALQHRSGAFKASEHELQSELQDSGIPRRRHLTKVSTVQVRGGIVHEKTVCDVECFSSELQFLGFT